MTKLADQNEAALAEIKKVLANNKTPERKANGLLAILKRYGNMRVELYKAGEL
jgi:hypothetical protein